MKTERLSVTLLERDKIALKKLAEREGEAMSVVIRKIIREAVDTVGGEQAQPAGGQGVQHDAQ